MLQKVKEWIGKTKGFLGDWSKKIRYVADLVDWFVNTLDSLPLPKEPGGDKEPNG